MSRLTEKVKNIEDYIRLATKDKQKFINKLGKLEDLEEQIGCPLEVMVVAFKALSSGIYAKDQQDENKLNFIPAVALSNIGTEWYLSNHIDFCVNIRDHKTLFWLREDKSE